jgi:hypothetical protein
MVDLRKFDLGTLRDYVCAIDDMEELQGARNHLLVALLCSVSAFTREIEALRFEACPQLPEVRVRADGTVVNAWTKRPNQWSVVSPNDIHEYESKDETKA